MTAERIDSIPTLHPRYTSAHKGDFGRVLIVGGSRGMAGAAALAGMAALRGGAGLVEVAAPEPIVDLVASFEPSYMTCPLPADGDGRIAKAALKVLLARPCDVMAVGPGLGKSAPLGELLVELIRGVPQPMVLDADALNLLAERTESISERIGPTILTPHPGEFARLTGLTVTEVNANRAAVAADFAHRHGVIVVLKGSGTIVTDGVRYAINATGNPGMATGGSGDVLTGLIAALFAQGYSGWDAARLGAHLHGRAGDIVAQRKSEVSLIARDLVEALPDVFHDEYQPRSPS